MTTLFDNIKNAEPGLRFVVYRHFLKSAVVPLCSLIGLMILLYFCGTYYTYQVSLADMRERAKSTVTEIAHSEARNLEQKLQEIARNTNYLQTVGEHLLQDQTSRSDSNEESPKLTSTPNGAYYRDLNTMMDGATIYGSSLPSSLYVPAETKLNTALQQRLQITEELDLHFQRTVDSNPNVQRAYFNSWDNTNRTYPPFGNVSNTHKTAIPVTASRQYVLADAQNNPERKTVWTEVYTDPNNRNPLLSSITPIYRHGFLEGVIGVDVALKDVANNLLSTALIWGSTPIITGKNGNILEQSANANTLLDIPALPLKAENSTGKNAGAEHNLFQHAAFNSLELGDFSKGSAQAFCCVWLNEEEYLLSQQQISTTDWRLIILTPINKVTQQVTQYQQFINNLGVYFVLLTVIFFVLFFNYLKKQANRLATRVSNPVELVTDYISRLNKLGNNKPLPVMQVGIRELDRLINSGAEIQRARSRLSRLNKELEHKNSQLQTLALTDRLTGLYNRHKLDEIIAAEMAKAQRYNNHFTVALLDIDHFKGVNDTYGHQVGDSILVGVSAIMRRRIRETDIVGRWGGEEFLILLPNTSLQQAAHVLDEMRERLSRSNFEPVETLTVSLGLASSATHQNETAIIAAADEALYRAKNNGRNRLEIDGEFVQSPKKDTDNPANNILTHSDTHSERQEDSIAGAI